MDGENREVPRQAGAGGMTKWRAVAHLDIGGSGWTESSDEDPTLTQTVHSCRNIMPFKDGGNDLPKQPWPRRAHPSPSSHPPELRRAQGLAWYPAQTAHR